MSRPASFLPPVKLTPEEVARRLLRPVKPPEPRGERPGEEPHQRQEGKDNSTYAGPPAE